MCALSTAENDIETENEKRISFSLFVFFFHRFIFYALIALHSFHEQQNRMRVRWRWKEQDRKCFFSSWSVERGNSEIASSEQMKIHFAIFVSLHNSIATSTRDSIRKRTPKQMKMNQKSDGKKLDTQTIPTETKCANHAGMVFTLLLQSSLECVEKLKECAHTYILCNILNIFTR